MEKVPAFEELKLLHDSWVRLWQTYVTWFTWHFGLHIATFAGLFQIVTLRPNAVGVAKFLIAFAVLGLLEAIAALIFDLQVKRRAKILGKGIGSTAAIFGGFLTQYAGPAMILTNLLVVVAWGYVVEHPPGPTQLCDR
jgi:hypothetical protein